MQKKKSMTSKFNFVDVLFCFICILGMSLSFYLFQKDLNMSLTKLGEEPIAVIYFKYNTAQRRLIDRNLWERLKQASPIYNGDRVRTSELSEAVTVFEDGTRLELHENSLVQIFSQKEKKSIDFISGSISASTEDTNALDIVVAGKTVSLDSKTAVSLFHPLEQNKTDIDENKRSVQPASLIVDKGSILVRDFMQSDIPEIVRPDVSSVSSIIQDAISTSFFTGSVKENDSETIVTKYTSLDLKQNTLNEEQTDLISLSSGEKAILVPTEYRESFSSTFLDSKIEVLSPTSSKTVFFVNDKLQDISFTWNSTEDIIIEFSYDNDFSQILYQKQFNKDKGSSSISLETVQSECTLFWRVYSIMDTQRESSVSGIMFVEYPPEKTVEEVLVTVFPSVKIPEDSVITVKPVKIKESVVVEPVKIDSAIQEDAKEVKVEIKKEEEVVKTIKEEKPEPVVKKEEVKVVEIPKITKLSVKLLSPENSKIFDDSYFETNPTITFSWNEVENSDSYVFELYSDSKNQNKQLLSKNIKETSYILTDDDMSLLDEGNFEWSVIALDKDSNKSLVSSSVFIIDLSSLENIEIETEGMINNR